MIKLKENTEQEKKKKEKKRSTNFPQAKTTHFSASHLYYGNLKYFRIRSILFPDFFFFFIRSCCCSHSPKLSNFTIALINLFLTAQGNPEWRNTYLILYSSFQYQRNVGMTSFAKHILHCSSYGSCILKKLTYIQQRYIIKTLLKQEIKILKKITETLISNTNIQTDTYTIIINTLWLFFMGNGNNQSKK